MPIDGIAGPDELDLGCDFQVLAIENHFFNALEVFVVRSQGRDKLISSISVHLLNTSVGLDAFPELDNALKNLDSLDLRLRHSLVEVDEVHLASGMLCQFLASRSDADEFAMTTTSLPINVDSSS
jgi:hypothetical protein